MASKIPLNSRGTVSHHREKGAYILVLFSDQSRVSIPLKAFLQVWEICRNTHDFSQVFHWKGVRIEHIDRFFYLVNVTGGHCLLTLRPMY